jgi:hypothetical protein
MEDVRVVERMDAHAHRHLYTDSYYYTEPDPDPERSRDDDSGEYYGETKGSATFPVNVEDSNNTHIRVEVGVANDQDNDGGLLCWAIEMVYREYE